MALYDGDQFPMEQTPIYGEYAYDHHLREEFRSVKILFRRSQKYTYTRYDEQQKTSHRDQTSQSDKLDLALADDVVAK